MFSHISANFDEVWRKTDADLHGSLCKTYTYRKSSRVLVNNSSPYLGNSAR